jgi:uncharacterized protein (TIGR02246 family)
MIKGSIPFSPLPFTDGKVSPKTLSCRLFPYPKSKMGCSLMKSSDCEKIRSVFEEVYPTNVRKRDLSAYANMYTKDALWMAPGVPDRSGIADIVEGFAEQIAQNDIDPIFTAEEIKVMGDFGYVIGISLAIIRPKDGSPSRSVKFRALWLMKKEQDVWKISRQIWNNKPQ